MPKLPKIPVQVALAGDAHAAYFARHHAAPPDIREWVLAELGSFCACCGESDPVFLTIDHVRGDGHLERKGRLAVTVWRRGCPRDRYQLLCLSCNAAKGQQAECPHQTEARRLVFGAS